MKICVYGAGAVGGLIAAWLSRSGEDVSVVARGAALDAIRAGGLRVRSGGKIETFAVRADSAPAKLGAQDYVVVAVKAQSLAEVASRIAPLVVRVLLAQRRLALLLSSTRTTQPSARESASARSTTSAPVIGRPSARC